MELGVVNPLGKAGQEDVEGNAEAIPLSLDSFAETDDTLAFHISQNKSVNFFLKLMGVFLVLKHGSLFEKVVQGAWGTMIRGGLAFFVFFGAVGVVGGIGEMAVILFYLNRDLRVLIGVTMLLQGITLGFALWDMNRRINSRVTALYCTQLSAGLRSSYLVFIISFIVGIFPMMSTGDYVLMGCEIVLSCLLTATMYFISTDCSVALSLMKKLAVHLKTESVTFEQYAMVRTDIQDRQQFSAWINNSIVVVALLDIAAVIIFVLTNSFTLNDLKICIIILGLFFKEIPFLMVVYWQVAQVNEQSAKFLQDLGSIRWSHSDNDRLVVFASAQSRPITMSLAGMKLKRRDLAWQFALWLFALAVSFFKAAIAKRV